MVTRRSAVVGLALALIVSAVIQIHTDKRRYDETLDFPYPRIDRFPDSQCLGQGCLVDGVAVSDPVWSNDTIGNTGYRYRVGGESDVRVVKTPAWSHHSHRPVFLSMVVLSAPNHFEERQTVRQEFARLKKKSALLANKTIELTFLLGSVASPGMAKLLDEEHFKHGDFFQVKSRR